MEPHIAWARACNCHNKWCAVMLGICFKSKQLEYCGVCASGGSWVGTASTYGVFYDHRKLSAGFGLRPKIERLRKFQGSTKQYGTAHQ